MKYIIKFAFLGCLCAGCTASPPGTFYYDAPLSPDVPSAVDGPTNCPSIPTTKVPVLDQHPQETCYTFQAFRGAAAGAETLIARGELGTAKPAHVDTKGRFCVEVNLKQGQANTITFIPYDATSCPGPQAKAAITHKPCIKPDAGAPSLNVAPDATVSASKKPSKGANTEINDKDIFTVVEYSDGWGWGEVNIWIKLALKTPVVLDRIVVKWRDAKGNGCDYASKYRLLASPNSNPGEPDLKQGVWTEIVHETKGDGGTDTVYPKSSGTLAAHVALYLHSNGCNGWTETFAISDLEIWGQNPNLIPQPQPDRCQVF